MLREEWLSGGRSIFGTSTREMASVPSTFCYFEFGAIHVEVRLVVSVLIMA